MNTEIVLDDKGKVMVMKGQCKARELQQRKKTVASVVEIDAFLARLGV